MSDKQKTKITEQNMREAERLAREIHQDGFSAAIHGQCAFRSSHMCELSKGIAEALQAKDDEITALLDLVERLKQEARHHAQEARTANSTLNEIYQFCSGYTGENGNWNGSRPVEDSFEALAAQNVSMREFIESFHISVGDNFYKDTSISTHNPHSFYARIGNDSTKSWIFADLEERRKQALSITPTEAVERIRRKDDLLRRAHDELLAVLESTNADRPHFDGDDFHALLIDIEAARKEGAE